MKIFCVVLIFCQSINGKLPDDEKTEFCENLNCDQSVKEKVCGVRYEDNDIKFKVFDNECRLLQYGCQVDDTQTYGIIDMKRCVDTSTTPSPEIVDYVKFVNDCPNDCSAVKAEPVCGIRKDGDGFKIRTFNSECLLLRHNCKYDLHFIVTDFFICANDLYLDNEDDDFENELFDEEEPATEPEAENKHKINKMKNLVVVDGSLFERQNVNESIRNFFAATHVLDLPVKDMQPNFNETTRRMMVNIFGPVQVFKPWIKIPKNISDDYDHKPTLSSCYHKCPTKCPDTYAPVCGVPGIVAREPSLMFQNHCFMDVAQCKMHWEGKSYTAESSAYIESSFIFCLGDELNGLYRFLPLVKTLQHMGRLKNKGHFKYKLKNMRFFNNLLSRQPRIMG